jgi:hypothetical protein
MRSCADRDLLVMSRRHARAQTVGMVSRARAACLVMSIALAGCASAPSPSGTPNAPSIVPVAATQEASPSPTTAPTVAPTLDPSALVAADLDGLFVPAALAHRLPLVVSIDDARVARPQSGFNAASIVYQAPADGYETRYLMVFQEMDATDIGPVRSARIYLAQWASELNAALGHYGGDRLSLAWIKANGGAITNVDGIGSGNSAYHRISSRDAPHNAYTSTASLWKVATKLGGAATIGGAIHLRPFRDDAPAADHPASQTFSIPYRTVTVGYVYDRATNSYKRSLDGKAHIDPMDRQQVTARTVVILYMTFKTDNTIEPGHNRPVLGFVGTGKASIFAEGRLIQGTWSKAGPTDPTFIFGPDGDELPLVRGRIFIQAVPIGTKITVN